jgi:hypothetical protein
MKLIFMVIYVSIMCGVSAAQTCLICEDGAAPQYSDVLLKFFPGTLPQTEYTCKELHFLGMYNDGNVITPEMCTFLVRLASFSCGCHGGVTDQRTNFQNGDTQAMDVTATGASNDVILSSTFVANQSANSTAFTSSTNPTTAPMPTQSDRSDFPSSNPTMKVGGTMAPSFSPHSTRHSVPSENSNSEKKMADPSDNAAAYHSMLMEIIQKLKNVLLNFEQDESSNVLPTNHGKLRGM